MKATIDARGMLVITPETGIEAYALSHWSRRNLNGTQVEAVVDMSNFPSLFVHASDCAAHKEPARSLG
jgi:hypothetical protein